MPLGWQSGRVVTPANIQMSGTRQYFGHVQANTGVLVLTHGIPNAVFPGGGQAYVAYLDYLTD
jgi:hypothetical protein